MTDVYTEDSDIYIFEAIRRHILETDNNIVFTFHCINETKPEMF